MSVLDINALPWSDEQKLALQKRVTSVLNAPPTVRTDLTLFKNQADARPLDQAGGIVYPLAGAGPAVIVQYVVPKGLLFVNERLAVIHYGGNPPDGTGQVIWRVVINGAAVKGLG